MSKVDDALGRLTGQFDGSPVLRGLVAAIVAPLDNALTDAEAIKTQRWINTAAGAQLDGCGAIVGESRMGRGDEEYRAALRFRVFVNVSQGTPQSLIRGLKYLVDSSDYQYLEIPPATAVMFADGPVVPRNIAAQIQDLAPAAISDVPVCVSYAEQPFRFARENPGGELFVNDGASYLTGNGSDIQVSTSAAQTAGPTLGGIAPADLFVGAYYLDVGGSILVVNSPDHQTLIDTGYHLTGVFQ